MADRIREILAVKLKQYRTSFGYSQMKLAEIAGLSTSLIASFETCKKFPSSKSIEKLSNAFGLEPYLLFQENPNKSESSEKVGILKEELKTHISEYIESSFQSFLQDK